MCQVVSNGGQSTKSTDTPWLALLLFTPVQFPSLSTPEHRQLEGARDPWHLAEESQGHPGIFHYLPQGHPEQGGNTASALHEDAGQAPQRPRRGAMPP